MSVFHQSAADAKKSEIVKTKASYTKKALSIAINYRNSAAFSKGDLPPRLDKTHNDPELLKKILTQFYGYKLQDISVLKDDGKSTPPTRANILEAIDKLVKNAKAGDHFVFHFSGHGSQVECDDNDYEPSGMDEVIWPVDVVFNKNKDYGDDVSNYIKDDELRKRLVDSLPVGAHLTVILDCCHSGTGIDLPYSRSDDSGQLIWSPVKSPVSPASPAFNFFTKSRSSGLGQKIISKGSIKLKMPFLTGTRVHKTSSGSSVLAEIMHPNTFFNPRNKGKLVTSWSACVDDEVTYEGQTGGMLLQSFWNILRQNNKLTNNELLVALSKDMASALRPAKFQSDLGKVPCPKPTLGSLQSFNEIHNVLFAF